MYNEVYKEKISQIDKILDEIAFHLNILKEYLNNKRKFYCTVRKMIGTKKSLQKVLINLDHECVVEPLN